MLAPLDVIFEPHDPARVGPAQDVVVIIQRDDGRVARCRAELAPWEHHRGTIDGTAIDLEPCSTWFGQPFRLDDLAPW